MTDSPASGVSKGGSPAVPPLLFSPFRLPANRFAEIFEDSRSAVCAALVMRYRRSGGDRTRVGVIAAKKTFRLAVERSRARRLLREAFRLERPGLAVGYDLILLGRRQLLEMSCDQVRQALRGVCRRARLLKDRG